MNHYNYVKQCRQNNPLASNHYCNQYATGKVVIDRWITRYSHEEVLFLVRDKKYWSRSPGIRKAMSEYEECG